MAEHHYDLVIVGGGVSGTALCYMATRYSNIKKIAVVEKYSKLAQVSSLSSNNSQTLHCGDIETNYTIEKAIKVQSAAKMLFNYTQLLDNNVHIISKFSKMVVGIGDGEVELLKKRYEIFSPHYPNMRLYDKKEIKRIEPLVVAGFKADRPENIIACGSENEYCAVDFSALSHSFIEQAEAHKDNRVDVYLETKMHTIRKYDDIFEIQTNKETLTSTSVVVSTCGHSLLYAQAMGYGLNFSCLPVAGSFYFTPKLLNGKVYTVQNDKLPFAAIHGDPDLLVEGKTRFGPTALLLPMLERYNPSTIIDFLKVLKLDSGVMKVFWDLFKDRDIRNYIIRNMLFEVPILNTRLFLKDARKIIPSLLLSDIKFAKGYGGVRPQLIDKDAGKLLMGEAKITPGNGIVFNMTPSPGATSCLDNAEKDLRHVCGYLGATIDEDKLATELK
ncbi:Malate:quinone oxidoreductase [hydrothermal vent metagenome]|uniref:Malate:quinone oxidoreductase n=1 Tax=hydrothermal vent metagenome TaxID=652676 RepID=A0A3B1AC32_9ZZZZ